MLYLLVEKEDINMKNTSRTMYRIGNIINIFFLALGPLLFLIGIICIIVGAANDNGPLMSEGGKCIGWGIWFLVAAILCFVFVGKAQRQLGNDREQNRAPFIVTIVFGAVSTNPCYVLAGIFGLIADGQKSNDEQPKVIDAEPVDEDKAE